MMEECAGTISWQRPNEFIADYYITKEIASRYPLKNISKFKKFIYESYNHESCPLDVRKKKKGETKKEASSANYNSDNKRIFKTFFKYFDKTDITIIKLIEKEKEKEKEDVPIVSNNNPEEDLNENNEILIQPKQYIFGGSKILLDEKSSYFNKWISSLLQFLREFDIQDEVKFIEKIYINIYKFKFI